MGGACVYRSRSADSTLRQTVARRTALGGLYSLRCFCSGGPLAISAPAFGYPGLSRYLGPLLIACMTVIPTWIAFGPGPRHCSGGLSFLGIFFRSSAPGDTECRVVFGGAAVLMWVLLIWATVRLVCGKKGD